MNVLYDLWRYTATKKKWWLLPTVFFLMIVAVFGLSIGGISIPPILYTLF
jgi:hypothetical protein